MSEAKHTPGAWRAEVRMHCWAIRPEAGEDIVYVHSEPGGSVTTKGRTVEEMAANARLIAASPELLWACRFAIEACDAIGKDWNSLQIERHLTGLKSIVGEAIAKVEGK